MVSILNVRKGARVRLRNGWEADVADNATRQHTRVCTVYGFTTEMGSVYSTDIEYVKNDAGRWVEVEHPVSMLRAAGKRQAAGW